MLDSLLAGIATTVELVDLREHDGVHPRVGAADVVPLVPLSERRHGARGRGRARARRPDRRRARAARLPVRRGGLRAASGLLPARGARRAPPARRGGGARARTPARSSSTRARGRCWSAPATSSSPTTSSSRPTTSRSRARSRGAVRESSGGMPGVQAIGLHLPESGRIQVSMNVIDLEQAPLHEVVARVRAEAAARGVEVAGGELVGLVPERVLRGGGGGGGRAPRRGRVARPRTRSRPALDSLRARADRPHRRGSDPRRRLGGGASRAHRRRSATPRARG